MTTEPDDYQEIANTDSDSREFTPIYVKTETSIFVPANDKPTIPSMSNGSPSPPFSFSFLFENREDDEIDDANKIEWNSNCNKCGKICLTNRLKTQHVPKHLNIEDGLPCPFCTGHYRSYESMGRHLTKVHKKTGGCNKWLSREIMNQFLQTTRDKVKEYFSSALNNSKYNHDKSTNIDTQAVNTSCNLCSEIFDKKYRAIFHAQTHMDSKESLICPYCPSDIMFRCKTWSSMKLHLNKFHKKSGSLYNHMETHILVEFRERVNEKVRDCFGDSFDLNNDDENDHFDRSPSFVTDADETNSPAVISKTKEVILNDIDETILDHSGSDKSKPLEETVTSLDSYIDSVEQIKEPKKTNLSLMCQICSRPVRSRQFQQKSHAKSHMDNDSGLLCPFCTTPNYFCYELSLRQHLIKIHNQSAEWREYFSITEINRFRANVEKKVLECFSGTNDNFHNFDSPEPSSLAEIKESKRITVIDLFEDEETETRKSMKLIDNEVLPVSVIRSEPSELITLISSDVPTFAHVAPIVYEQYDESCIRSETSIINTEKNFQINIRTGSGRPLAEKIICQLCSDSVSYPFHHINSVHLKAIVYKCTHCSYGRYFGNTKSNRRHIKHYHSDTPNAKIVNITQRYAKEFIECSLACFGTDKYVIRSSKKEQIEKTTVQRKQIISEKTSKDKMKHNCRLCNISVSLPLRHICMRHLKKYVYKCNQCSFGLFSYEAYENRHHTRTKHPNNRDAKIVNCTDDFAEEIIELSRACFGTEELVCHENPFLDTSDIVFASLPDTVSQPTSPTTSGRASYSDEFFNTSPIPPTNFPFISSSTPATTIKDRSLSIIEGDVEVETDLVDNDDDIEEIDTVQSFGVSSWDGNNDVKEIETVQAFGDLSSHVDNNDDVKEIETVQTFGDLSSTVNNDDDVEEMDTIQSFGDLSSDVYNDDDVEEIDTVQSFIDLSSDFELDFD